MGGEHTCEPGAFDQRAIFGPAHRAVIWIGPQQPTCQLVQDRVVRRAIGAADVVGEAVGAVDQRRVAQVPDQRVDVTIIQGTGAYAAADRQSDQQDRIAEGILTGACSDTRR